jgi:hypothetical protein
VGLTAVQPQPEPHGDPPMYRYLPAARAFRAPMLSLCFVVLITPAGAEIGPVAIWHWASPGSSAAAPKEMMTNELDSAS